MPSIVEQFTDDFRLISRECLALLSGEYGPIWDPGVRGDVKVILQDEIFVYERVVAHIFTDWTDVERFQGWQRDALMAIDSVVAVAAWMQQADYFYATEVSAAHKQAAEGIAHAGARQMSLIFATQSCVPRPTTDTKKYQHTFNLTDLKYQQDGLELPAFNTRFRGNASNIANIFYALAEVGGVLPKIEYHAETKRFSVAVSGIHNVYPATCVEVMQPGWVPNPAKDTPQALGLHVAAGLARDNDVELNYLGDGVFELRLQVVIHAE